jgi:hypothetical protein
MKKFLTAVVLLLLILGVLVGKIYFDIIGKPHYYLKQIGTAILNKDLDDVERWVDFNSIAQGIVDDYFAGLTKQPDPAVKEDLWEELMPVLAKQLRDYVKTGQLNNLAPAGLSKTARFVLEQVLLTGEALKQFQKLSYIKESGRTAVAGFKSSVTKSDLLVLELKLKRGDSGWRVVRINNFTELQKRLHRREKQKNIKIEDFLIQGTKNSVIWGKFDREEVFLELNAAAIPGWPTGLAINLDEEEHLRFTLSGDAYQIPLQVNPGKAEAFEVNGRLNKHYYVQAGEYDFDSDGLSELVVAIGDNSIDLVINVFKYTPKPSGGSAGMKPENWVIIGTFMGQNKAFINGRNIRLPYTAVNIEMEYKWVKNGFREVN